MLHHGYFALSIPLGTHPLNTYIPVEVSPDPLLSDFK